MHGRVGGHELFAQRGEDLVAEQCMQNGVGVVERFDQPDLVGVAIDAQSVGDRQGRRIDDGSGDRAGFPEQVTLQVPLQLAQPRRGTRRCIRLPRHQAARCAQPAATSRAICSSATSSLNAGMLSSRSIMVGTAPSCVTAAAYRSQTGAAIGWS